MPATAGRVRMPANNRVHSSAALQTHGIWQSAIGYDPYAPNKDSSKQGAEQSDSKAAASVPEGENAYASFQGLLALARLTSSNADEARGACKKCGRVGHLTYQCRNFLSVKEDIALQTIATHPEKSKANGKDKAAESEESSEAEEESESSDSSVDSEIERIIAARSGKGLVKKSSSSRKSKHRAREESDSDSEEGSTRRSRKKGAQGHQMNLQKVRKKIEGGKEKKEGEGTNILKLIMASRERVGRRKGGGGITLLLLTVSLTTMIYIEEQEGLLIPRGVQQSRRVGGIRSVRSHQVILTTMNPQGEGVGRGLRKGARSTGTERM